MRRFLERGERLQMHRQKLQDIRSDFNLFIGK